MGESQGKREPHLGERKANEREHGEERVDSTRRIVGQREERRKARRISLGEVGESMRSSWRVFESAHPLKPEMEKEVRRRRARL